MGLTDNQRDMKISNIERDVKAILGILRPEPERDKPVQKRDPKRLYGSSQHG